MSRVPTFQAEPTPAGAGPGQATLSSGVKAGLRSGADLKVEASRIKRAQDEKFNKMDPEASGRAAQTVYRDRHGRKLDMLNEMVNRDAGVKSADSESNYEWGVGAAKKKERENARQRLLEEKEQPFARLPDDPSLDAHFRDVERWGDPMAALLNVRLSRAHFPSQPVLTTTHITHHIQYRNRARTRSRRRKRRARRTRRRRRATSSTWMRTPCVSTGRHPTDLTSQPARAGTAATVAMALRSACLSASPSLSHRRSRPTPGVWRTCKASNTFFF